MGGKSTSIPTHRNMPARVGGINGVVFTVEVVMGSGMITPPATY